MSAMSSEQQNGITMENEPKEEKMDTNTADEVAAENKVDEADGAEPKEEEEEEEEESDEEELPLGSVEAPVQIMTGKRDRKKVERLVVMDTPKTPEKKFEVPTGRGVKLGDIEMIAYQLDKFKAPDLKPLHKFLFGRTVKDLRQTKRNCKEFSGFNFEKDDPEYVKRENLLVKFTVEGQKELCTILDVEKKGTKDKMMERLMEFCLNPQPSGRKPPEKGKRGRKSTKPKKKTKKPSSGGPGRKKKKATAAGGDASTVSEEDELDTTAEDGTEGDTTAESLDTSVAEGESQPKKTKSKSTPKKKEKSKKDTPKGKTKTPKKKKMSVKSPSKQAKSTPAKAKKTPQKRKDESKTPQKRKVDEIDDGDSSDDEPLVKKSKSPPTDKELRETIQSILDGANLEEVTMKMVCRRVYDSYPDFPLQHKKDFIKSTVREIIS
ncbi:protein DEK-like [Diadema antillarum]|uniref:protein DEK-like n=1 Tax=Diadema antillarum TaxID=105358 RepID=UPI003A894ED8